MPDLAALREYYRQEAANKRARRRIDEACKTETDTRKETQP